MQLKNPSVDFVYTNIQIETNRINFLIELAIILVLTPKVRVADPHSFHPDPDPAL
jgi:hypothetical protein